MYSSALVTRAQALVAESQQLVTAARLICTDAIWVTAYAQEVRGARRILGSSEGSVSLVALVLSGGLMLCSDCLAKKTGVERWQLEGILTRVKGQFKVVTSADRCDGCLKARLVHRLG